MEDNVAEQPLARTTRDGPRAMSAARNYANEMMTGINQLKEMRDNVSSQIDAEKAIYNKLKDEIATLNERLWVEKDELTWHDNSRAWTYLIFADTAFFPSREKSQANLDVLLESRDAYTKSAEECELVCESQFHGVMCVSLSFA